MNAWCRKRRAARRDCCKLIERAHEYFSEQRQASQAGGVSSDERSLVAARERVRRGRSPGAGSPDAPGTPSAPRPGCRSAKQDSRRGRAGAPPEPENSSELGEHRV